MKPGRPPPIELDRIIRELDWIRPGEEAPEQFWQLQFKDWQDWCAGAVLAFGRALSTCSLFNRPPLRWMLEANLQLCMQHMTDDERRARRKMNEHFLRWKAVKLVRGRHPNDPRNYERKVDSDDVWEEAAKMLADMGIKCRAGTVKKSYQLIEHAGGAQVTLPSYKREVEERDRPRREKKKIQGRLLRDRPTPG